MAKGDGSITERKRKNGESYSPKSWRIRFYALDQRTGKNIQREKSFRGTYREALQFKKKLEAQFEDGFSFDSQSLTFGEYADRWALMRSRDKDLSTRTKEEDKRYVEKFKGFIGGVKLADVSKFTIEYLMQGLKDEFLEKHGKEMSGTTERHYFIKIKQILNSAITDDLLIQNACNKLKAPKKNQAERRSLNVQECKKLNNILSEREEEAYLYLEEKELRLKSWGKGKNRTQIKGMSDLGNLTAVRIAFSTGMRLGECLGLTWKNVSLTQARISVVQALDNHSNIKLPKSKSGIRNIYIDEVCLNWLIRWKEAQAELLEKIGLVQSDETFVCCSNAGTIGNCANFERWFKTWREQNGFFALKFHELRHTQATQLLANNMDIKSVSARIGHASVATTLDIYAHALPENDKKASLLMESIFTGKPKETPIIKLESA